MSPGSESLDAVVIGGGFYGVAIAIYLKRQRGLKRILIVEQEQVLLSRASYNNQARVHNGYHYPRSFTTAYRSRINLPKFARDWSECVQKNITTLYAIARRNSQVTAKQFERFCREIGARLEPAEPWLKKLFEPRLIENVFCVDEYVFDASRLAAWADQEVRDCGVQVRFRTRATAVFNDRQKLRIAVSNNEGDKDSISCRYVFNCTYSGINQSCGEFPGTYTRLKHEIAEIALIKVPSSFSSLGITVMDGPFFSIMPFPARGVHTLSHVRYTPHCQWSDVKGVDPYERLKQYDRVTHVDRMLRDVKRYVPQMIGAEYVDSLFEVKTVLTKNEGDDGRPILFEKHDSLPGCFSILGSKIDNIYDVFEKLDSMQLCT